MTLTSLEPGGGVCERLRGVAEEEHGGGGGAVGVSTAVTRFFPKQQVPSN